MSNFTMDDDCSNSDFSDSFNLDHSTGAFPMVQLLRNELVQKDQHIANLEREHATELSDQKALLDEVEHLRNVDRAAHEQQLQQIQQEFELLQTRLVTEVEGLRMKHNQIETTVPQLQLDLAVTKDEIRSLSLSEQAYKNLIKTPEEAMSLRDFVRVRAYEEIREARQLATARTDELDDLKARHRTIMQDKDRLQRQVDNFHRQDNMEKASADGDVHVLTVRCEALQQSLTDARIEANAMQGKAEDFDKVNRRYLEVQGDLEAACKELVICKATLSALESEHRQKQHEHMERDTQVELLKMNEVYLNREVEQLQGKVLELSESLAKKKSKVAVLKQEQQQMLDRVSKQENGWQRSTEETLQQELSRLRDRSEADKESIRTAMKDTYERESRILMEAKETAVRQLDHERQRTAEGKQAYDQLMSTHRDVESKLSNQCVEARGQLKIKTYELDRVSLQHVEAMTNIRSSKMEIDALQKKVKLLKQEYYKVDTDATKRNSMLEARCSEQSRRISHYERLEKELDCAVLDVGHADEASHNAFAEISAGLPSDGARRIRQSIQLARQVAVSQQDLDTVTNELNETKKQLMAAKLDALEHKKACARAVQPQSYLVEVIDQKEQRAVAAEEKVEDLTREIQEVSAALKVAQEDVARLLEVQRDVGSLFGENSDLSNLKAILQNGGNKGSNTHSNSPPRKLSDSTRGAPQNAPSWYKKLTGNSQ